MESDSIALDAELGRLALVGDIEAHHDSELTDLISRYSDGHRHDLLLDLTAVTFLPSSIVGTLLRARMLAVRNGVTVTFTARAATVPKRVLEVCGIPHEVIL
ncbi:STAS domain-containing protein [Nocardioides sp. ChNu-99]|uniref:STAS domain-containing protein n=1 Tax=Nocardioides sp. ChNu-99 TaxID=2839897 RepID=UPI0024071292|nr:STAS domain-containing protein [Nocardioides sp. ChNu-99]MDF9716490.1 STAS domain-containing protein [Nocardioides sp. ChNu-99]